jgi:hypothetical protein
MASSHCLQWRRVKIRDFKRAFTVYRSALSKGALNARRTCLGLIVELCSCAPRGASVYPYKGCETLAGFRSYVFPLFVERWKLDWHGRP